MLTLVLLVLPAAPLTAQEMAPSAGNAAAGAGEYAIRCARCHRDPASLAGAFAEAAADAGRADELARFLTGHRAPGAQLQADLAAYLLSL